MDKNKKKEGDAVDREDSVCKAEFRRETAWDRAQWAPLGFLSFTPLVLSLAPGLSQATFSAYITLYL